MAKFSPRRIQEYVAGKTVVSARDINDIVERLERLESMMAIPPLRISQTKPYNIMLMHEVHEMQLVSLESDLEATRYWWNYGKVIDLDVDTGFYDTGNPHDKMYGYYVRGTQVAPEVRLRFRNPFLFTGSGGDYALIAKMPQLDHEFIVVQIMCPGAIEDPDATKFPFRTGAETAPAYSSANFRLPIPMIPGMNLGE